MVSFSVVSLLALGFVAASAQDVETSSFNVTEALLDLGINVAEIPALDEHTKRSVNKCAAAVSASSKLFNETYQLISKQVLLSQIPLRRLLPRNPLGIILLGLYALLLVRPPSRRLPLVHLQALPSQTRRRRRPLVAADRVSLCGQERGARGVCGGVVD